MRIGRKNTGIAQEAATARQMWRSANSPAPKTKVLAGIDIGSSYQKFVWELQKLVAVPKLRKSVAEGLLKGLSRIEARRVMLVEVREHLGKRGPSLGPKRAA